MLEDRDYMRGPARENPSFSQWFSWPRWSWTVAIIVINVVCFLLECAVSSHPLAFRPDGYHCYKYLALSVEGVRSGYVWQLLTYQFMHASILHLLFNCWAIFIFGRILEDMLGSMKFLFLMLASGAVGGLFQLVFSLGTHDFYAGAVGASAGAFGLVAAFATLIPDEELFLMMFMIVPVQMRARTLLIVSLSLAIAGMIFPAFFDKLMGANVANAAHLGGMVAGILMAKGLARSRWLSPESTGWLGSRRSTPPASPSFWRSKPGRADADLSPEEILKTQVDPILDKISAHGLHSLTAREREILEKASGKLAKR